MRFVLYNKEKKTEGGREGGREGGKEKLGTRILGTRTSDTCKCI